MKRIAAPMVGGMLTSTVLTLAVIPAIYSLWKQRELRRAEEWAPAGDAPVSNLPPESVIETVPG